MTIITDIKQQEKLEKFFKEENTWFPDNVGEKFLAIFFFIISGILACAPNKMIDFSDLNNDMKVVLIGYMFYILGVTYMVMKYKSYQEAYSTNRKRITTKEPDLLQLEVAIVAIKAALGEKVENATEIEG